MAIKRILAAALVVMEILVACSTNASKEGTVEVVDGLKIVNIYGTWEQMGSQYGHLLSNEICNIWEQKLSNGMNDSAWSIADSLYSQYPQRFKTFIEACAASSGLSLNQMKAVNAMEYIDWILTNCSGIAVWGDMAAGELVYGRTYDAGAFHELAEDIVVTVFHPEDSRYSVATVGFAGEVYCVNGLNSAGLFLELNSGAPSAGFEQNFELTAGPVKLLEMLLDAGTMEDVDMFMNNTRSSASFIIGVADSTEARSYEWCSSGCKRGDVECSDLPEGGQVLVQTNHYVNPEWNYPIPADSESWRSLTRRKNMISWVRENSGDIDSDLLQSFVQTPLEDGGIFVNTTEYMIVAVPSRQVVSVYVPWIQVYEGNSSATRFHPGWHTIDLSKNF